jgi:hypothetical protein
VAAGAGPDFPTPPVSCKLASTADIKTVRHPTQHENLNVRAFVRQIRVIVAA